MKKLLLSILFIFIHSIVLANPVNLTNQYFFRIVTGPNSVNYPTGNTMAVGAYAEPTTGTTVTAHQGTVTLNLQRVGDIVGPNEYSRVINYNELLTGSWTIKAINGADQAELITHSITGVAALPFVENVMLDSSSGVLTPTISWTVPNNANSADTVRVGIYDDFTNQRIFHGANMPISTTSFTVPGGYLNYGGSYAIRVFLEDKDAYGATQSRSQTFVNFTPISTIQPVILPSLTTDPNPNDNLGAAFLFNCTVTAGETVLIDPFAAIGYDYEIGENNPNFASVTLPVLGNNKYELWLFNGIDFVFSKKLTGGITHSFGKNGVSRFRILGIETSLGIDPANTTAFITGLTFVSDGKFTGSMTPIINQPNIIGDWNVNDIETLTVEGFGKETRTTAGIVRFSYSGTKTGTIDLILDTLDSQDVNYTGPFTINNQETTIKWSLNEESLQDYQAYIRGWLTKLALAAGLINNQSDLYDIQLTNTNFHPIIVSEKLLTPSKMSIKAAGIASCNFGGKPMTIEFMHESDIDLIEKKF